MRKLTVALVIGLLASSSGLGVPVQKTAAASSTAKVVIVVGAVEGITSSYRGYADAAATVFYKYTSNVIKVYSPNATWANVQAAAQGANVLVYMGHGSGFPSPYVGYLQPDGDDGMGLNSTAGNGDSNKHYYGENYMAQLGLAPNAVVILNHLCYASGNSEPGNGLPTLSVAETRVDNYASGFLRGNARAVIAEAMYDLGPYVDRLFTQHESIDHLWRSYPGFHNNVTAWSSTRNSNYMSEVDPDYGNPQSDGDYYYRSLVTEYNLNTDDVFGATPTIYAPTTYHAITPVRLLDTRYKNGLSAPLQANAPVTFQITGREGIPAKATAVTGNLTVTDQTDGYAVYLGPDPLAYPSSSTINFVKGDIIANGVTVALSSKGQLSATYMAPDGNTTDLVFDVSGYFTPDKTGDTYHPISPVRLLDTRYKNGLSAPLKANTPVSFDIWNRLGIPNTATAVTGNVTVTDETAYWAIYIGPDPIAYPGSSTLNFVKGDIRANNVTVPLSSTGQLSATYMAPPKATTNLVFDVTGYFTHGTSGYRYVPMTPARLLDTRYGNGLSTTLNANTPVSFQVSGRSVIPTGAKAITANVTVTDQTDKWAIYVGPDQIASPGSSNLNFVAGDIRANGVTVAINSAGQLSATYMSWPGNTTDLVCDVTGYFVP